jgi:hypothetical protein
MDIVFNGIFGGTDNIDNIFFPLLIKFRKTFKLYFEKKSFGNDLEIIKFYILINGEIGTYHPETGVYNVTHYKKNKEIRMDLCYAGIENRINKKIGTDVLKNLIIKGIEQICNKCGNKKLDFKAKEFSDFVLNVLKNI